MIKLPTTAANKVHLNNVIQVKATPSREKKDSENYIKQNLNLQNQLTDSIVMVIWLPPFKVIWVPPGYLVTTL